MIKIYSIFNGAKYFFPDGQQNYLLFISTRRVEWINIDDRYSRVVLWRSTRMSQESIENSHTSGVNFAPKTIFDYQLEKWN